MSPDLFKEVVLAQEGNSPEDAPDTANNARFKILHRGKSRYAEFLALLSQGFHEGDE